MGVPRRVRLRRDGPANQPHVGDEFSLGVGDAIKLTGVDLRVEFTGVSGDSRCPMRVQCVWAGDGAVVLVSRAGGGAVQADTLHTNLDPKRILLGTVELTLVRLDPYPDTPGSIPGDDYVATLTSRIP